MSADLVESLRLGTISEAATVRMREAADEIERLERENKRLRAAMDLDRDPPGPAFLTWLADRLVHVYGESPNVDFARRVERGEPA